jgi:hypothetical protein
MKLRYSNGWNYKRFTLVVGGSLTRFGFGFCISRWHADLDLGFFWIGVEW